MKCNIPKREKPISKMRLYDLNRSAYGSFNPLEDEKIEEAKELLNSYINAEDQTYFMLLNNDLKYYTVLKKEENITENIYDIIKDCLVAANSKYNIVSIEKSDEVIEIWAKTDEKLADCFILFRYDFGVVPIGE